MGVVYIVYDHHPDFREAFAAKTFQDEIFARAPAIGDRFRQEALTWVNLDTHQNVVEAQFVQTVGGKPYLFLEYVNGGDLSSWVNTPRLTKDLPQVLRFAIQFCDGMTHALSKGITAHRDIKPQNCLVTHDGTLKVTDFGLAKAFDGVGGASLDQTQTRGLSVGLTRTGTAAGTCTHMAPEQFDDAKHVDVRADVYSFGVMLYQMAVGKLPFVGRTRAEYERLHKDQPAPVLKGQLVVLGSIVERCLAKEARARYGNFVEVRAELVEVYEHLVGKAAPGAGNRIKSNAAQSNNKGVSLNVLGQPGEALVSIDRALELNPRNESMWSNKGVTLVELGRYEEALACHERALELNPLDESTWSNKGNVLQRIGRYEEALVCNDRALALNPHLEHAWLGKGVALVELGRPEEALECYDRALEIDPHDKLAWSNKGVTLVDLAWYNKGVALVKLGRPEEALECYDRALGLNPRYEQAWYNKGNVLIELERYEEALACNDHALDLNPRYEQAWNNKGVALDNLGRFEETLECYDRALELNPRYEQAWYNKGVMLANDSQHYREALTCFEEAQRLGLPQAAQAIALCLQKLGSDCEIE